MVAPIPEHLHTVTPRLVVHDRAAAIDFYRAAFVAEEVGDRFTSPDGTLIHAEIRIGDSVVMITEETPDAPARSPLSRCVEDLSPDEIARRASESSG